MMKCPPFFRSTATMGNRRLLREKILKKLRDAEADKPWSRLSDILQTYGRILSAEDIDWLLSQSMMHVGAMNSIPVFWEHLPGLPNIEERHLLQIADRVADAFWNESEIRRRLQNLIEHPAGSTKLHDKILEKLLQNAAYLGDDTTTLSVLVEIQDFWTEERVRQFIEEGHAQLWKDFLKQTSPEKLPNAQRTIFETLIRQAPAQAARMLQNNPDQPWARQDDWTTLLAQGNPEARAIALRAQKNTSRSQQR